jgi:hypothetical protein
MLRMPELFYNIGYNLFCNYGSQDEVGSVQMVSTTNEQRMKNYRTKLDSKIDKLNQKLEEPLRRV